MKKTFSSSVFPSVFKQETLFFAVFLFIAFIYCIPWHPEILTTGIDPSWRLALHYFFGRHLQFGKDILFSHGPYGFVNTWAYYPATYMPMLAIFTAVIIFYSAATWKLLRDAISNLWVTLGLGCVLALAWNKIDESSFPRDVFFYSGCVLCFMSYWRNWNQPYRWLHYSSIIFLAFLSLVKAPYFLAALVILFFITADEILFKKRFPVSVILFVAGWLCFWTLAGQAIGNAPQFLALSFSYSSGYGAIAGTPVNEFQKMELIFIAVSAFFLLGMACFLIQKKLKRDWLAWTGLAALLFLIYRAAFTRSDHASIGIMMIAILAVYLIPWVISWPPIREGGLVFWILGVLILCPLVYEYSGGGVFSASPQAVFVRFLQPFSFAINPHAAFQMRLIHHQDPEVYGHEQKNMQNYFPLPPFDSTVDIYPYDSSVIIAHGFKYAPRPVFQSQAVFSEAMSAMNANYLKSDKAAEFVLIRSNTTFDGGSLYNYYPSMFDSLSMPELLARYEPYASAGRYTVLKKSAHLMRFSAVNTITAELSMGTKLSLPLATEGLLWAKFELKTTWLQKLSVFFGKSLPLKINIEDIHGMKRSYNFVPELANIGFLISPLLQDDDAVALLYSHQFQLLTVRNHIRQIEIETPKFWGWQLFIKPQFKILFSDVVVQSD